MSVHIEPTRYREQYAFTFSIPTGLEKSQAINWFVQHRKPKLMEIERFTYDPISGVLHVFGIEKKQ